MKILNLGSLNFDKVYQTDHFVSPGETISSRRYQIHFGGKGLNQSIALARAGAEVFHAGAVGFDGRDLVDCLSSSGVDTSLLSHILTVSGHAIIQNSQGQNCIIVFGGANQCLTGDYIDDVLSHFSPGDLFLTQNEVNLVPYAIERAKALGMRIAFNASPITPELMTYPLELVDIFLVNEIECRALCDGNGSDYGTMLEMLHHRFPDAAIVLTVGEGGVYYAEKELRLYHRAYRVPVVDTTGAGDTFCGFFLAALTRGLDIPEALAQASKGGALSVSRMGAADSIPTLEQVLAFGD